MLGDRVRMQAHAQDSGVFIRSMATRGHLGGLARATTDAAMVLDAAGKDFVAIETVGVGQDEVDIARAADVSIVVLVPGMGDEVQALKAGVMEIADIFVVNKADRDGADRAVAEIESLLGLHAYTEGQRRPPIVRTEATTGRGLDDLIEEITRFSKQASTIEQRRRDRARTQLRAVLAARLMQQVESRVSAMDMGSLVDRIAARTLDPYTAADQVLGVGGSMAAHSIMKAVLDHVGIAVADLDASLSFFRDALGLHVEAPEEVGVEARARAVCFDGPDVYRAHSGDSARFADCEVSRETRPRASPHHAAGRQHPGGVGGITGPRSASHRRTTEAWRGGCSVAFIHPSSAQGVLVELKQAAVVRPLDSARHRAAVQFPENHLPRRHRYRHRVGRFFDPTAAPCFGVVPKTFWEKKAPPDDRNRIRMAMRRLLLRGARTMLIDAGSGDKMTPSRRTSIASSASST